MEDQYITKVEAFVRGEMNDQEAKQFEQELEDNPDLADYYKEYTLAMEVVDQQVEKELKDQFKDWEKEVTQKPKGRVVPLIMKIAATLVILLSVYIVFLQKDRNPLPDNQLAISSYTLPESPGSTMGSGNELWSTGLQAFESKNYQIAIDSWEEITDPNPEVKYYLAHAYFNAEQFDRAIDIFKALANGNSTFNISSDWYLLLAYLADGQKDKFSQLANKIANDPNHPYQKDVVELKEKMEK